MNSNFTQWLEEQTYNHIWNKTGRWIVVNEEYNNRRDFNWGTIIYQYKLIERIKKV
jgi:hypothetical protein